MKTGIMTMMYRTHSPTDDEQERGKMVIEFASLASIRDAKANPSIDCLHYITSEDELFLWGENKGGERRHEDRE
jgi:hypothetical protein